MDLASICSLLKATQEADATERTRAEETLSQEKKGRPDELCNALVSVIAAGSNVAKEVQLQAAVILRQCVHGTDSQLPVWEGLNITTTTRIKAQCLTSIESDPDDQVRRQVAQLAVAIVESISEDFGDILEKWPEFLPAVNRFLGTGMSTGTRVAALTMLKELEQLAEGLLSAGGDQLVNILRTTFGDQASEVRAAGAQLVLQFIEVLDKDDIEILGPIMPSLVTVIQGLANPCPRDEELLKNTLEGLSSAIGEEAGFFKSWAFQPLWETLMRLAAVGNDFFTDATLRHDAMEAAMTLATELSDDFSQADAALQLEKLIGLNLEWMLEVEQDVQVWLAESQEEDESDDCDGDLVSLAEQNLDRLGENFQEDVLMPILFKVSRNALQSPGADWRHARASILAMSQVAEYLDDESWVQLMIDFIVPYCVEEHPRVKDAAFLALGQICYDQDQHVQENYAEILLPKVSSGIDDENIRVSTTAVSALVAFVENGDLEYVDLKPFFEELLLRVLHRLIEGQTRAMQKECLSAVGLMADAVEEHFLPYYSHVMPTLKKIASEASSTEERELRGKTFECISAVGASVGKEAFLSDARDVMELMMRIEQDGLKDDDPLRQYINTAAMNIAETLEKDFKPYVPAILSRVFDVLKQTQVESNEMDDSIQDDDEYDAAEAFTLGLNTGVSNEMRECLELMNTIIEALGIEFSDFLDSACTSLQPLLESQRVSEDLRKQIHKTYEALASCAREASEGGRLPACSVHNLLSMFLQSTIGRMKVTKETLNNAELTLLQIRATGAAGVIRKAGDGVLAKESVHSVMPVVLELLGSIKASKELSGADTRKKDRVKDMVEDDENERGSESDDDDDDVSEQSVRLSLADVSAAVMKTSPDHFLEVLPGLMELVQRFLQPGSNEADKALAFYITGEAVNVLGPRSVTYWNFFMNQVLQAIVDQPPAVAQYAATTLGHGAKQAAFSPMTMAAAGQIHAVLTKFGEKHRRRRAVKADAMQRALALDAAIWCFGFICEHHGHQLGSNAAQAWGMWLAHLPLRYSQEQGQSSHEQLLRLVVAEHPVLTSAENLPRALGVFAQTWKTKFSNPGLDKDISTALSRFGLVKLQEIGSSLPDRQRKKIEDIVELGQDEPTAA